MQKKKKQKDKRRNSRKITASKTTKKSKKARKEEGKNELEIISNEVERKTKIKTSPAHIEDIISAVKVTDNFWQIVGISQKPIPVVAETLKLLKKYGFVEFTNGAVRYTEKLQEKFGYIHGFLPDLICSECEGRGINIKAIGIYDEFYEIQKERPPAIQKFDQGYITPDSTVARVLFMRLRGDISKKRIVILGDDDLVGIAIGLTRLPEEVVVLDIDKRIIDFTNRVAEEKGLPVRAEVFDLRNPLPNSFKMKFDVFLSDPPEAKKPFSIFLEKGIWCLKGKGSAGYVGMTLIDSSVAKWRELQRLILDSGAAITDIIRDFNRYEIWDYHEKTLAWKLAPVKSPLVRRWYSSALVRLELVNKSKARNLRLKSKDIYVDEESTTT